MPVQSHPGLYALLNQIIDYAGLFPPANLPLPQAIQNFIRYRTDPERWMLSRFIIPATRLDELTWLMKTGLTWDGMLSISVLGRGNEGREPFLAGLEADLQAVSAFRARWGARIRVDVYETRLPASELGDPARAGALLAEATPSLRGAGLFPFFEAPFGAGWEQRAEFLIQSISTNSAGFKLRTGGVTVDAFPSPVQVAFALIACRDAGAPMKCTAGLHHPVRSYREEVLTKMYGFLNVFGAGILAQGYDMNETVVQAILEEETAESFSFCKEGFQWHGYCASVAQIEMARQERLISFGSCSFDEPRDDLRELGFELIKS